MRTDRGGLASIAFVLGLVAVGRLAGAQPAEIPAPPPPSAPAADASAAPASSATPPDLATTAPEPSPAAPASAPVTPPPPPPAPPLPFRGVVAKASLLAGSVATFAGFLVLMDAFAKSGKLDAICIFNPSSGQSVCPGSASDAINSFNTEVTIGGVASLVGIALLTTAYFTYSSDYAPKSPAATSVHFTPTGFGGTF
jgi:hypothetical protein